MAQDVNVKDVIDKICQQAKISRDEVEQRAKALRDEFGGLLTEVGSYLILADKLGVKTQEYPVPVPQNTGERVYPNDAGTCTYCGGKKTWGSKVPTRNGKMAPAHIDDDGHLIGDCPKFTKPAVTDNTPFTSTKKQQQPEPSQRKVMDDAALAELLAKSAAADALETSKIETPVAVPKSEDDVLADLLASAHPDTCTCDECKVALGGPAVAANITQSATPNGNRAPDQPAVQASHTGSIAPSLAGAPGPNPGKVAVAQDHDVALVTVRQLDAAVAKFDATMEAVAAGFHALAQSIKDPIIQLNEKLGTIGTILAGFKTIIEQATVTNTAALSVLEEKVKSLEEHAGTKPVKKNKKDATAAPEEKQ